MLTTAPQARWISNDAFPGVRAHVTPAPSAEAALVILAALQEPAPQAGSAPQTRRMSAWHRVALLEATGTEGDTWEPSA